MSRLGKKRGTGRGRRAVVWTFVCPVCEFAVDFSAKRRPTGDPDDVPNPPTCVGRGTSAYPHRLVNMENRGLFFLTFADQRKSREPAAAIRQEWDRLREKLLRGRMCECGHWRMDHEPTEPHECRYCSCAEFRKYHYQTLELGHDSDVPF